MSVSVSLTSNKAIDKVMDKLESQVSDYYKIIISYAVNEVRNQSILGIQSTPKTGKSYKRGGKSHTASSAGNPPAIDSGTLVNSIKYEYDMAKDIFRGEVSAATEYAADLEFGTVNMAARPFMQPALEKSRTKILNKAKQFRYKK
jgi:HK97 gp10 family phage protein